MQELIGNQLPWPKESALNGVQCKIFHDIGRKRDTIESEHFKNDRIEQKNRTIQNEQ
jgi:hypothetical protein